MLGHHAACLTPVAALSGSAGMPAPTAVATVNSTSNLLANQHFQRDSTTGGQQGFGQGAVPISFSAVTQAGTIHARCSSGGTTRGDLQAEWAAATIASTGAQTVNITGVDVRLGYFYVDILDSSGTWQNGTVLIAMGGIFAFKGGQSLLQRMIFKLAGDGTTIATALSTVTPGASINPNGRIFAAYGASNWPTTRPSVTGLTWELPADAGHYTSAGVAKILDALITSTGFSWGLIGHSVDGTAQSSWLAGTTQFLEFQAVANAAGNKWEAEIWWQGHEDAKNAVTASQYAKDMGIRDALYASLNTCVVPVKKLANTIPNINEGVNYGPSRGITRIRAGGKAGSPNYVNMEGLNEGTDGIHPLQLGCVTGGVDISRGVVSDNIGPALVSATRSGTTITATLSNLGTDLQLTGTWYSRFVAYASGSTYTKWPISGGAKINATTITLTLANDPGDGTVIDLWLGAPVDGDGANDPSPNMIRDNRTDTIDSARGRTFQPSLAAVVVAAPSPGGTQNTPPGGIITPTSQYDLTTVSPSFGASALVPGFGNALVGGYGYTTWSTFASLCPMSVEAIIKVPSTPGGNVVIAGFYSSGIRLQMDVTRKVNLIFPGGAVNSSALTTGDIWYICGVVDEAGKRLYVAKWNGSSWNAGVIDGSTATPPSTNWALITQRLFVGASSTGGSSQFLATGGAISNVGVWGTSLYTGSNFTAPTAPRTFADTANGLMCMLPLSADGLDGIRWA